MIYPTINFNVTPLYYFKIERIKSIRIREFKQFNMKKKRKETKKNLHDLSRNKLFLTVNRKKKGVVKLDHLILRSLK